MTSTSNAAREVSRLNAARTAAAEKFKTQSGLLANMEKTEEARSRLNSQWHAQLAALAKLCGGAAAAAELSRVLKTEIDGAVKSVEPAAMKAELEAARPRPRKRRRAAAAAKPAGPAQG